jgi:hypothetical protein
MSVLRNSPAPTISSRDIATCATIRAFVNNERAEELELLKLSLSAGARSTLVARHAGARPKRMPAAHDSATVKTNTRQSSRISSARIC